MNNLEITSAVLHVFSLSLQPCSDPIIRHILRLAKSSRLCPLSLLCYGVNLFFNSTDLNHKILYNFIVHFLLTLLFISSKASIQILCCHRQGPHLSTEDLLVFSASYNKIIIVKYLWISIPKGCFIKYYS